VFAFEEITKIFQLVQIEDNAVFEGNRFGLSFLESPCIPFGIDQDLVLQLFSVFHKITETVQKLHPDFAEKRADHHIELLKCGFFFSAYKKSLDDQKDQKDIEKQKPEIPYHINKDMVGITENEVMNRVRHSRGYDKKQGDPECPVF
jgi:hypothetical protein